MPIWRHSFLGRVEKFGFGGAGPCRPSGRDPVAAIAPRRAAPLVPPVDRRRGAGTLLGRLFVGRGFGGALRRLGPSGSRSFGAAGGTYEFDFEALNASFTTIEIDFAGSYAAVLP